MIKVGDRLPEGTFRVKQDDDSVKEVAVADLFKGQNVVLVGVPGAFTSTCHKAHIPQFVTHASEMKAHGVDRIVVMAVNDHHVMKMWGESLGGHGKIDFVADGDAVYATALGLAVKIPGMGTRVRRFSALVDDGVVKTLNFEPEGGKGIQVTGAEVILAQLASAAVSVASP
ncbi:MAG TPA: peroxiredoxin [Bauldia sp.]|nr:peroxiredoxin [Bauldia sp.]